MTVVTVIIIADNTKKSTMTIEETTKLISEKTGIPAELITGENAEQIITRARQLLEFKRETEPAKKDPSEQFARRNKTK